MELISDSAKNISLSIEDFHSILKSSQSILKKKTRDERETYRVAFVPTGNVEQFYFLKRYMRSSSGRWLGVNSNSKRFQKQARQEWNAITLFSELDFPVPKPVAFVDSDSESFVLMTEVESKGTLQHWFQNHSAEEFANKRSYIIERLAKITQRMHSNNLHHQDYYLGHFLFDETSNQLSLIDLGRAGRIKMLRKKWIIKDLAQLHYSSINCWTDQEFVRFLQLYLGHSRYERLMASILVKSMKIAKHSKKHNL